VSDTSSNGRVRLGARLRHAREQSRMSLSDVAERAKLSKAFISRVERDETSPSVASLVALCEAISLPLDELFATPAATLIRAADRTTRTLPGEAVRDTLITPPHERHVTVLETLAAPGGSGGADLYTLRSQCEVCYVLEGAIEIDVETATFRLDVGDALTFGAAVPHTWRNVARSSSRVLWILAPALPDPRAR
jgi:transcriptional regulator with XRE-family HTH domain